MENNSVGLTGFFWHTENEDEGGVESLMMLAAG